MNEEFSAAKVLDSGEVVHGDDSRLHVEFRMEPILMGHKSEEAGRPIYEERPFIRIMFPGDKTKTVDREVTDHDKLRFARRWDAFEKGAAMPVTGTPLEQWPMLSRTQVLELKGLNIMTVEQLADMPDSGLTFLGGLELRSKASVWLKVANDTAAAAQFSAQNEALRADLAAKDQQLKDMAARIEALEKGKGK